MAHMPAHKVLGIQAAEQALVMVEEVWGVIFVRKDMLQLEFVNKICTRWQCIWASILADKSLDISTLEVTVPEMVEHAVLVQEYVEEPKLDKVNQCKLMDKAHL